MSSDSSTPDTIVLVHGFWVTPRSWEDWITHYEGRGYRVLAPAYPGFEVEVEALNADPSPIEALTVPAIIEKLEGVIGELDRPPIIMGHSAGGAFTQILLDHGFGAVGVAINSAPTEGVRAVPPSQLKATLPVLKNPANRHKAVGFTHEQWHYAFTNTFSEEESRRLYERYHVPASGHIFWDSVLANLQPGHQETWVDYRNDDRAPLLFLSGSHDNLMPPKIQQSNAKHYKSDTITEVKEFEGPHLMPSQEGWEEIADYALEWAEAHARTPAAPA
jgi:pimeloyl-ACP methyl ester carboxylesterase